MKMRSILYYKSNSSKRSSSGSYSHCSSSGSGSSSKNMSRAFYAGFLVILISLQTVQSAPLPQHDDDSPFPSNSLSAVPDYNMVMGHFKDFFMYLPVVMSTLKETMTGFPKFAEGIRILTSKTGRMEEDCKCNSISGGQSNEIENTSRFR